jgi:ABC-type multidrug transport system fused ATPase/permease subunit
MSALPVADGRQVRAYAVSLARRHPRKLGLSLALYAAAALAGLVAPRLLGALVEAVERGTTAGYVDRIALLLAGAVLLQTVLTKWSRTISLVLAEEVFADLREDFLERVVALPLSTVERAGSGDLLSRTTSDIDTLAKTVRYAVPEVLVATVTAVLTIVAAFVVSPLVASAMLVSAPLLWLSTRWYLRRRAEGYLAERASYAVITAGLAESAEGARTVESLRRQQVRRRRSDDDIAAAYATSGTRCGCGRSGSRWWTCRSCCRWCRWCWSAAGSTPAGSPRSAR